MPSSEPAPPAPESNRRTRRLGAALLLVLVALGLLTAWELYTARRDLLAGQAELGNLDLHTVDRAGGIGAVAGRVDERVQRADRTVHRSVGLRLLAAAPLVGIQVGALSDLTAATADVSGRAARAAAAVETSLDQGGSRPAGRLRLLDTTARELAAVRREVRATRVPSGGPLVAPPLADARRQLTDELAEADRDLVRGIGITRSLRRFLAGPRRYLVLAANNAEMRGGGGMPLSAGVARVSGGEIDPGDFNQTGDLNLGARGVAAPADLQALYGFFGIGREYRNATASPNFPRTAPLVAAMAARTPERGPVDGVVMVDVVALRAMLAAVGPVQLDGFRYTADNVAERVLHENYLDLTNRKTRVDHQARLATAIFDVMNNRPFPVTTLAAGLVDAARGRHVLAWSRDEREQALWDQLGITGELDPDGLMISVENNSGSKLDWFVQPTTVMQTRRGAAGTTRVSLSVAVANPKRKLEASYVETSFLGALKLGQHRVVLAVYLPREATDVSTDGTPIFIAGPDPPMRAVLLRYVVDFASTRWVRVSFTLPPRFGSLRLLPGGRYNPMVVWNDGVPTSDAVPVELVWRRDDEVA